MDGSNRQYRFHEVCRLFPGMAEDEFDALVEDVRLNRRLTDPIVRYRGEIIDGRHRLQACIVAGVEPRFTEWDGRGSLVKFVASKNLHRRHLTPSQRAAVGAVIAQQIEREAAESRAAEAENLGQNDSALDVREIPAEVEPKPRRDRGRPRSSGNAEAAAVAGTSVRAIQEARMVQAHSPDLFDAVAAGEVSLHEAAEQVRGPVPVDGETIRNRALASLLDVERALGDLCETEAGGNVHRDKALAALFRLRSLIVGGARKVAKRGPFNPAEIDLPAELDTEAFRAKWREWCEYRAGKRKPVSAVAAARSLEKCRAAGVEAACRAVDESIAADWQGLFPQALPAAANDKLAGVRAILNGPARPRRGQQIAPGVELLEQEGAGDGLPW